MAFAIAKNKPPPVLADRGNMCMKNGKRFYARWLLKDHAFRREPEARNHSRRYCRQSAAMCRIPHRHGLPGMLLCFVSIRRRPSRHRAPLTHAASFRRLSDVHVSRGGSVRVIALPYSAHPTLSFNFRPAAPMIGGIKHKREPQYERSSPGFSKSDARQSAAQDIHPPD
jgi:hypothetical protein